MDINPAGARLEMKRSVLGNTWTDLNASDKLVVGGGLVNSMQEGSLICGADNVAIVTLRGASWNVRPGQTGSATCDQCTGTPTRQTWTVISAD